MVLIKKVLFILFLIHCIFNLEKNIFINEIFTVFGMIYFFFRLKKYLIFKKNSILTSIFFLLIYGFAYSIYSYFVLKDGNNYQFLRTTVLIYSIFCFYLGIEFFYFYKGLYVNKLLQKIIGFYIVFKGQYLSRASVLSLVIKENKKYYLWSFIFFALISIFRYGSTNKIILLFFIINFIFLHFKKIYIMLLKIIKSKIVLFFILIISCLLFIFIYNNYNDFYSMGYKSVNLFKDVNTTWRLMFWSYLIKNKFLDNIFTGIGFGTKLFDSIKKDTKFITDTDKKDKNLEYTLGTHNSYLFILIRTGIIGIIPFILIYSSIFNKYINQLNNNILLIPIFLAFCYISISAMFNVILESPKYSGIFWILLGILYGTFKFGEENV